MLEIAITQRTGKERLIKCECDVNLVDVWREVNLEKQKFTWRRKATHQQARLDFFLISEFLFTNVEDSKLLLGYKTDHSFILLKFDFGKFQKGKTHWKFNNSLLKDENYVTENKKNN